MEEDRGRTCSSWEGVSRMEGTRGMSLWSIERDRRSSESSAKAGEEVPDDATLMSIFPCSEPS